jgi:hypothetical protein
MTVRARSKTEGRLIGERTAHSNGRAGRWMDLWRIVALFSLLFFLLLQGQCSCDLIRFCRRSTLSYLRVICRLRHSLVVKRIDAFSPIQVYGMILTLWISCTNYTVEASITVFLLKKSHLLI